MSPSTPMTPGNNSGRVPDSPRSPICGRVLKVFSSLPISCSYSLEEKIGEGTFSTVYLAKKNGTSQVKDSDKNLALKLLVPTSKPGRISMEIKCMQECRGHPNVVSLLGVWRSGGDVVLGMPFVDHCKFMDLVATADLTEVKLYIANLISALSHIHKIGIIHRDIKPSNFLYDRKRKKFALVDFGLAQWSDEALRDRNVRGVKRKAEEESSEEAKRIRTPLAEANRELTATPKMKVLRELKGDEVRRSPRKTAATPDQKLEELEVVSPASGEALQEPKQRISFGSRGLAFTRSSPRKLNLPNRGGGVSKLTIQNTLCLQSGEGSALTPTLSKTNSFTLLEPSCLSQATDTRTPLLRASVTSLCSSTTPRPDIGNSGVGTPGGPRSYSGNRHSQPVPPPCSCRGLLQVCEQCQGLSHLHAARAGTPGFRPPEVLLKCHTQTVAVDMWAVGVILLSLLARAYPFFRSPDDITAIGELLTLFGTKPLVTCAARYGRILTTSQHCDGEDLAEVCRRLSSRCEPGSVPPNCLVTKEAISLLKGLLSIDYAKRLTAKDALQHTFIHGVVQE